MSSVSSVSSRVYTIEEYRKSIQYLKQKCKNHEMQQVQLLKEYQQKYSNKQQNKLQDLIDYSNRLNCSTIKIQSLFKGYKIRELIKKQLLRMKEQEQMPKTAENMNLIDLMQKVCKFFRKNFGLSMESIFRALDIYTNLSIETEDLRNFLLQYPKLKITQAQLMKILFVFDEDLVGKISKINYYSVLIAYGIGVEKCNFKQFEREIIVSLNHFMAEKDLECEQVFNACAKESPNEIKISDFIDFLVKLGYDMKQFEQQILENVFDYDDGGKTSKEFFLQKMKIGTKKRLIRQNFSSQQGLHSQQQLNEMDQSAYNQKQYSNLKPNGQDLNMSRSFQGQQQQQLPQKSAFGKTEFDKIQNIFEKIHQSKEPFYQFLEHVLDSFNLGRHNLTIKIVMNSLETVYPDLISAREKGLISQLLNPDKDGNLELFKSKQCFYIKHLLKLFYLIAIQLLQQYSIDKKISLRLVLLILGKQLEFDHRDTEQYLQENNVKIEVWYDIFAFRSVIAPVLGMENQEADEVFKQLEKGSNDKIKGSQIVELINDHRVDMENQAFNKKGKPQEIDNSNMGAVLMREMEQFKLALEKNGLNFNGIWLIADSENKNYVGLPHLLDVIKERTKGEIPQEKIMYWLDLIDSNHNGIIDQQEFELSTAIEDSDFTAFRLSKKKIENEKEMIDSFLEALNNCKMSAQDFFELSDKDGDKEINLIELKIGLGNLKLPLPSIITLLQIFDKNSDGSISLEEYIETLGINFMTKQQKVIKGLFISSLSNKQNNIDDTRGDFSIHQRLDAYGEEKPDELLLALHSFKKFCLSMHSDMNVAYEKLFSEFDVNLDFILSRNEFLMGLDKYNHTLQLSERQKIRLMMTADVDKNDKIDFNEFKKFLDKVKINEDQTSAKQKAKLRFKGGFVKRKNDEDNKTSKLKQIDVSKLPEEEKPMGKLKNIINSQEQKYFDFQIAFSQLEKQAQQNQSNSEVGLLEFEALKLCLKASELFEQKEISKIMAFTYEYDKNLFEFDSFMNILNNIGIEDEGEDNQVGDQTIQADDLDEAAAYNYKKQLQKQNLSDEGSDIE